MKTKHNTVWTRVWFMVLSILFTAIDINAQQITTYTGTVTTTPETAVTNTRNEFDGIAGGTLDNAGNLYISDANNNRICKLSPNGVITVVAGNGEPGCSGDKGPATNAKLFSPAGLALDKKGNLLIADSKNNRIRKVNLTDGSIVTIAGTGEPAYTGNNGRAVQAALQHPKGITTDAAGNIYFSDCDNNCIRKINTTGIISVFAGTGQGANTGGGSFSGDGKQAVNAELYHPDGLAFDGNGNLYFADGFNHRIRKVNTNGVISTVAGNGKADYSGDGGRAASAAINCPAGITVDSIGNIYIADQNNNRVRVVNQAGNISTLAGNGAAASDGDGGDATAASIKAPVFVCIDKTGNLYTGENGNDKIRKIMATGTNPITNRQCPPTKMTTQAPGNFKAD